jgi:hypothetical protein
MTLHAITSGGEAVPEPTASLVIAAAIAAGFAGRPIDFLLGTPARSATDAVATLRRMIAQPNSAAR